MEGLRELIQEAEKANKSIDEGIAELGKLQATLSSSKDKEAIDRLNKAVKQVKDLKKQLDEHNSK